MFCYRIPARIVDATRIVAERTTKSPLGANPASPAPVLITNTVTKKDSIANTSITSPARTFSTRSPSALARSMVYTPSVEITFSAF